MWERTCGEAETDTYQAHCYDPEESIRLIAEYVTDPAAAEMLVNINATTVFSLIHP